MVRRLPKVYDGSHVDLPEVTVLRGRTVEVASATDVPAYGDGERLGPLPRTATVLPRRPLRPAGVAGAKPRHVGNCH